MAGSKAKAKKERWRTSGRKYMSNRDVVCGDADESWWGSEQHIAFAERDMSEDAIDSKPPSLNKHRMGNCRASTTFCYELVHLISLP